jgi:hypothetical protein
VIVRQHRPETPESRRRNRDTELGNVALEKRPDEPFSPLAAVHIRPREPGARIAASNPEALPPIGSHFAEVEARELDELHTTGQRLLHAAHERRRCAAEHEETWRPTSRAVHEHAEGVEQRRSCLDLIQDDELAGARERQLGVVEPAGIAR